MFSGGIDADGLPAAVSDTRRLAAVRDTMLLDTEPEPAFDDLAGLAAAVTGCERAFITLVDDRRSFWKSCVGVGTGYPAQRENPVSESFCYFVIGLEERFVVADAAADPRTSDHPSVGPMKIGAWAGYPILGPGREVLGSICVIDENPHPWRDTELGALGTLARAVSNEINLRRSLTDARQSLLTTELLARSLQESLLPPLLPAVPGLDTAASYVPAAGGTDVVGDFYDLFHARGPWWSTVVGDVCGKGVEAAKVTALARYTLRAEGSQHLSPATVLRRLNAALLDQRRGERFITAVFATFRMTASGMAGRLCTAGHPPVLIRRADGRVQEIGQDGTLLGIFADLYLEDVRFRLAPGDTMLLYTDGATEAREQRGLTGTSRPMFGPEALSAALAGCDGLDAATTIGRLNATLNVHSGGWASDDTALLVIRVPPREPAPSFTQASGLPGADLGSVGPWTHSMQWCSGPARPGNGSPVA
jgi:serine phosphatase RsbU (regulator of sigma subunit)